MGLEQGNGSSGDVGDVIGGAIQDVGQVIGGALKKKKRKPEPSPVVQAAQNIATIVQNDMGTLPSTLILGLAGVQQDERSLKKQIRLLRRQYDLPTTWLLRPEEQASLASYPDPWTGGELSVASFRRLMAPREEAIIAQIIESAAAVGGRRRAGVSPKSVLRYLDIITPLIGDDLGIAVAARVAADLAADKPSPELFKQNLTTAMSTGLAPTPELAVMVAKDAAIEGRALANAMDVAAFIHGVDADLIARARASRPGTVEQVQLSMQLRQAGVGNLTITNDIIESLRDTHTSYLEESRRIFAEIAAENEPGIVEKVFAGSLVPLRVLDASLRVVADPDNFFAPLEGWGSGPTAIENAISDAWDITTGEMTLYETQWARDNGIEPFDAMMIGLFLSAGAIGLTKAGIRAAAAATTTGSKVGARLLIGGGVVLDPFGAGLAVAGGTAAKRFLPFLTQEGRANVIRNFLTGKQTRLNGKDVAEYLVKIADENADSPAMLREATRNFRASFGTPGIHPLVANTIFDFNTTARAAGVSVAERARAVRELLGLSLGIRPPDDSLAFGLRQAMQERVVRAQQALSPMLAQTVEYDGRQIAMRQAQSMAGVIDDVTEQFALTGPLMHEIPRAKVIGSLVRRDGATARWWRAFRQMDVPMRRGSYFVFLPDHDPGDMVSVFERALVRSRVFSTADIAERRRALSQAIRPNNPTRELNMGRIFQAAEDEMFSRIGAQYGMDAAQARSLVERLHGGRFGKPRNDVFGVLPGEMGPQAFAEPVRVTQLRNSFFFTDPMAARAAIGEYVGTLRQMRDGAMRAVHASVPGAKPALVPIRHVVGELNRSFTKPLFAMWKRAVVVRIGYLWKVVFGDENARFLATRGLHDRIEVSRAYAAIAKRTGADTAEIEIRTGLEGADALRLKLPGLIEKNPLANTGALRVASGDTSTLNRDIEEAIAQQWDTVAREGTDPETYAAAWHRAIGQYAADELGQQELRLIADGVSEADAINRLLDWLHSTDGADYLARMHQVHTSGASMDLAVARGHEYLRHLIPQPAIAQATLDGTLTTRLLMNVPDDFAPVYVHGPAIIAGERTGNVVTRAIDKITAAILQRPTNLVNRQPFYRLAKRDMLLATREQVQEMGFTIDDTLAAGLEREAERYAIRQTKAVMFDFARQSRLGELSWFVAPFLNPFMEFFVVWPKIVKNNPSMVAFAARLAKGAGESGFIKVDESTGELVVPASNFAFAAPLLAMVTGGRLTKNLNGGWGLSIPLQAFNLFLQNSFPFSSGDVNLPIPTPGFSPPAQFFLQQVFDHNILNLDEPQQVKFMSWVTEFGEVNPANPAALLPAYVRHALVAAVPSWFEDETASRTADFLELQQAMGMEPDPEYAKWQAKEMGFLRALFSFTFPSSPRIDFPTAELNDEWRTLIEAHDGNVLEARKEWLGTWNPETGQYEGGRHSDLSLITISKTFWADERNPFPLPATEFAQRILESEGGQEFAEMYPEWAWAIIPTELRTGELDFGVWFSQLASGLRQQKSPEKFLEDDLVQQGWDAYFAGKEQWRAWQNAHPELSDGDPAYDARNADWKDYQDELGAQNPRWLAAKSEFDLGGIDPDVMRHARALIESDDFMQTDTGQWLADFLDLYDETAERLRDANISALYSSAGEPTASALAVGIAQDYERELEELNAEHPDGETAYNLFFSNAFTPADAVRTSGELYFQGVPDEVAAAWAKWGDSFEEIKEGPSTAQTELETTFAFLAIQEHVVRAFEEFDKGQNPAVSWWLNATPLEKRSYLVNMIGDPQVFWSGTDRFVMGLPLNKNTERIWLEWARARADASAREATEPDFGFGEALDRIDGELIRLSRNSKALQKQIAAANTWGYALAKSLNVMEQEGLVNLQRSREYWDAVFEAAKVLQQYVEDRDMHGLDDFDPAAKVRYKNLQDQLVDYVNVLREDNRFFRAQWDDLEEETDDPLVNSLMPPTWFRIGGE